MSLEKPQIISVSKDDDLLLRTKKLFSNEDMYVTYESSFDQLLKKFKTNTYQYTKLPVSDNELRLLIETALEKQSQFGTNLFLKIV